MAELEKYLETNDLFSSRQVGFWKGRSVMDQVLIIYSLIVALVDRSYVGDMVLHYFSKDFGIGSLVLLQKLRCWWEYYLVKFNMGIYN